MTGEIEDPDLHWLCSTQWSSPNRKEKIHGPAAALTTAAGKDDTHDDGGAGEQLGFLSDCVALHSILLHGQLETAQWPDGLVGTRPALIECLAEPRGTRNSDSGLLLAC